MATDEPKHFEPFLKPVAPILKGTAQKDQQYRVTDVLMMVGTWSKFRRHVSQKRKLTYAYQRTTYETVLIFEFFLPLTNETVLRNELDALFYKDTIQKKLLTIGLVDLKALIEPHTAESDKTYLDRVIDWFGEQVRGYSISHVNGRFRAGSLLSRHDAATLIAEDQRYLIDETTAVVRFIIPINASRAEATLASAFNFGAIGAPADIASELRLIREFFFNLFVETVVRVVQGEDEIWLLEDTGTARRLYVWEKT